MGVEYFPCKFCHKTICDAGDYSRCDKCRNRMCVDCSDDCKQSVCVNCKCPPKEENHDECKCYCKGDSNMHDCLCTYSHDECKCHCKGDDHEDATKCLCVCSQEGLHICDSCQMTKVMGKKEECLCECHICPDGTHCRCYLWNQEREIICDYCQQTMVPDEDMVSFLLDKCQLTLSEAIKLYYEQKGY